MKRIASRIAITMLTGAIVLILPISASAQRPGPPPQAPPPPPISSDQIAAVTVPLSVLSAELHLSDDQFGKIAAIRKSFERAVRSLAPAGPPPPPPPPAPRMPGGFGHDNAGLPPPPAPPMPPMPLDPAINDELRGIRDDASAKIEAVLTDSQKEELTGLIKDVRGLSDVGIPFDLIAKLALTSDQRKQIDEIAAKQSDGIKTKLTEARSSGDYSGIPRAIQSTRRRAHESAMDILTDSQQELVEQNMPRLWPRGGPGFGAPPGTPPPGGGSGQEGPDQNGGYGPPPPMGIPPGGGQ